MEKKCVTIKVDGEFCDSREVEISMIRDKSYGLKITKKHEGTSEKENIIMENITEREEKIKEIIKSIIDNYIDFSQMKYIVQDLVETV